MVKKSDDFIFVKATQKQANQFNVKGSPAVVIVDPDGQELARGSIGAGESALLKLWETAAAKYADKPISWGSDVAAPSSSKKLLIVGFEDESGEALKSLEDRMVAKYHDKCVFVKLPYEKNGELAKKWGVFQAPAVVLCDAAKESPEKNSIEKIFGKKTAATYRTAILKALAKIEAKK